jgi:hypothetical protein
MTDNTVDIIDRLPPEVRKPWRQKLPENYAKHIDELLTMRGDIRAIQKRLAQLKDAINGDRTSDEVNYIGAAIVLLECAEEKLLHTVPVEEYMPRESSESSGWPTPASPPSISSTEGGRGDHARHKPSHHRDYSSDQHRHHRAGGAEAMTALTALLSKGIRATRKALDDVLKEAKGLMQG